MMRLLGWVVMVLSLACSGGPPPRPTPPPKASAEIKPPEIKPPAEEPIDPDAPREGGAATCPLELREDPAWNALWPRCPMYYPMISMGGWCDKPHCMRPCLLEVSTGPDSDSVMLAYWYWYDDVGRVTRSLMFGLGGEIDRNYHYDEAGRVTRSVQKDGGGIDYRYDGHGRLTGSTRKDPNLSPMVVAVTHGPWGPTEVTTKVGDQLIGRQRYTYTDDGRIATEEDYDDGPFSMRDRDNPSKTFALQYDADGKLGGFRRGYKSVSFGRDGDGRVTSVHRNSMQTASLKYDEVGRLSVVDKRKVLVEGYREYRYDCEGLDPFAPEPPPPAPPPIPPTVRCKKPAPVPRSVGRVTMPTPLMIAAAHGRLDEVKELVAAGADIDAVDNVLVTPALGSAITNGRVKVVRYLLDEGASVDPAGNNGPLRSALFLGSEEVVARLLAGCIDPNRPNKYKRLPLEVAINQFPIYSNYSGSDDQRQDQEAYFKIIERLIAAGARVNAKPAEAKSYRELVSKRFDREGLHADYRQAKEKIRRLLEKR